jgi:PBP1b-binding outer membrane lipoprotein LpoB
MRLLHLSALLLPFLAACSSTIDRRVDPDNPDTVGGAVLESQDIRIIQTGVLASAPAGTRTTFHITEMRNESSDTLNRTMILMKLRTELFRGLGNRVDILDRSAEGLEAVRKEREAKRAGAVTANAGRTGEVLGSDYVLKGVIQDRVKQAGKLKSAYYLVTFELTDLETGRLVWTGDYEAKFESEKSVISR